MILMMIGQRGVPRTYGLVNEYVTPRDAAVGLSKRCRGYLSGAEITGCDSVAILKEHAAKIMSTSNADISIWEEA